MTKLEKQIFKTKYNKFWEKLGIEDAFTNQGVRRIRKLKDGSIEVIASYIGSTLCRTNYKELKTTLKEIGPFEFTNKNLSRPKWKPINAKGSEDIKRWSFYI